MNAEQLARNIAYWRERLGNAAAKWGGVEICGVTKTIAPELINPAYAAGITTIGENRVQELLEKYDRLDPAFRIELIGQLQTNKVKYILDKVQRVQSLDRDALAEEISKRAAAKGIVMPVLVEVSIAGEEQKGGIAEDELEAFVRRCAEMPGLRVEGLMAVMPNVADPEQVRPYFRRMRTWFETLRDREIPNTDIRTLSMGMSHDCIVAAEEGATMVRLGRSLFGERA